VVSRTVESAISDDQAGAERYRQREDGDGGIDGDFGHTRQGRRPARNHAVDERPGHDQSERRADDAEHGRFRQDQCDDPAA